MILPLFVLLGAGLSMANEVDVIPLVEEWRLDKAVSTYTIVTYSTLIKDGTHTVVVDLPPANETASIDKMLDAIKGKDFQPEDIQKLVLTHGHPKDFGHNSIFPKAHQYFSTYEHNGKTFLRTGLYENGKMQLTPNVQLWYTPGHSAEDITVVITKVNGRGTVAIAGNLIFNSTDVLNPEFWESRAQHVQMGIKRRRKVICHSDYVIPGHGPVFQVTEQHREAVKCQTKGENGAEDSQAEQQRRRRQHEQERNQQSEYQRREQLRRDRQAEYEQQLAQWNWEQRERAQRETGSGASSDYRVGEGASLSDSYSSAGCCQQQPCHNGQKLCKEECCVQPPCKTDVPPCTFETTCCRQEQQCSWNQVRCYQDCSVQQNCNGQQNCNVQQSCNVQQNCNGQQNCNVQQNCNGQQNCNVQQRCNVQSSGGSVSCGRSEVHHHYIGSTEEVFDTHIRNEQQNLITTLNDQQKQMREDQSKVNSILLDHIQDNYREFKKYVEEETQQRIDFNNLVTDNIQALINLLQQQQQLLQNELRRQRPLLDSSEVVADKVNRQLDEHRRVTDQWWTHQKHIQDTKKAQEEKTFKRIVRPAYNFTRNVPEEPQPQPQPCRQDCRVQQECNSGCAQQESSTGCASSSSCNNNCRSGCAQSSPNAGCAQAGCSVNRQHRHAPGQRHIGRRRLRRQEAEEKKKMAELQKLLTTEENREKENDD